MKNNKIIEIEGYYTLENHYKLFEEGEIDSYVSFKTKKLAREFFNGKTKRVIIGPGEGNITVEEIDEDCHDTFATIKNKRLEECNHTWTEERILTTPPEQYVQSQVSATLRECSSCGEQKCIYDDEEYNVL